MSLRIVPLPAEADPDLSFDTVIGADFLGDHALAGSDEGDNAGGLTARRVLETAVILSLFTDCAAEEHELRAGDEQRGYPGDAITLEPSAPLDPLGSKLWLLRRRAMDADEAVRLAEIWSAEALAWMLQDRVAARIVTTATVHASDPRRLDLQVTITGPDGTVNGYRYDILWRRL